MKVIRLIGESKSVFFLVSPVFIGLVIMIFLDSNLRIVSKCPGVGSIFLVALNDYEFSERAWVIVNKQHVETGVKNFIRRQY